MTHGRVAALVLGAVAFLVRILVWPLVFAPGGVYFHGPDDYYHARRIVWTASHFPALLEFDPYINFPEGGRPIWAPAFDFLLGALARASVGSDPERIERLVVWVPALLGAACVVFVYRLARRPFGEGAARVGALVLALLPAHATPSRLGYVDHHAAVAFVSVLLLFAAMAWLERRGWGRTFWLGILLGASFLVWPGCLLHVALVEGALALALVLRGGRREAREVALANVAAALVVLPFGWTNEWPRWGSFHPVVLSRFQPWLFGTLALAALVWGEAVAGRSGERQRALRGATAAGVLAALAGLGLLLFPEAGSAIREAWSWLGREEPFQAQVTESWPLFVREGAFDPRWAVQNLSYAVYAFPLVLVWASTAELRAGPRSERLLFLAWGGGLFAATCLQSRFATCFSIPFALALGGAASAAARALGPRRGWPAGLLALLLAFQPVWVHQYRLADGALRGLRGEAPLLTRFELRQRRTVETARWIRANTPPTAGYLEPGAPPEWGVLSAWSNGHVLLYEGERPVVASNFGDDVGERGFALSTGYFRAEEPAALASIAGLGVRYVVLGWHEEAGFGARSVQARLHRADGEASAGSLAFDGERYAWVPEPVPALAHHRLVFETEPAPHKPGAPFFKVYEVVPGARLAGATAPSAEVVVTLRVITNRGRVIPWRGTARADPAGLFSITVPYATDGIAPATRTSPHYVVASGRRAVRVSVSEAAVRGGTTLAVTGLDAGSEQSR